MNNSVTPERIINILKTQRFVFKDEKDLQFQISTTLTNLEINHGREFEFIPGCGDIIDFMIPDYIGMEIKIKGGKTDIYKQIRRYCKHSTILHLILVTTRNMQLPKDIEGCKCYVVNLNQAWL